MFHNLTSKKMLLIVFSLTIITLLGTSSLALGASTTKSLSSNYTLVNLSTCTAPATCDAAVTVKYIKDDGSVWAADPNNTNFNVPGNYGSVVVRQYSDAIMTEGRGSVVVSSGEPLGSVVQLQTRSGIPTRGAYSGISQGSSKFYVPIVERKKTTSSGIGNSQIIIQNADSVQITDVTIELIQGSVTTYTKHTGSLAPGQSFFYDVQEEQPQNVPDEWLGSAVVTALTPATGKLAVVSNFFLGPDAMQTFNAFPVESVGPKWIAPLFFSRLSNGLSTPISVQNLSGDTIPAGGVKLICNEDPSFSNPTTHFEVSNPNQIFNNQGYGFNPVPTPSGADNLFPMKGWGGSCQIDAGTYNVVALVQMRYVGVASNGAAAYEAIPVNGSTNKTLVFPLILKRLNNGFATAVAIQNLNLGTDASAIAHVHIKYTPSPTECKVDICDQNGDGVITAADTVQYDATIPGAGSLIKNHRLSTGPQAETTLDSHGNLAIRDGWQGSLVVTSSDQPINGFVQITDYLHFSGDTFMAHDAFSLP
jgi:hypothetical protein